MSSTLKDAALAPTFSAFSSTKPFPTPSPSCFSSTFFKQLHGPQKKSRGPSVEHVLGPKCFWDRARYLAGMASLVPVVSRRDTRFQPFPQRDQGSMEGSWGSPGTPPTVCVPRTWGQGWYVTAGGRSGRSSPRRGTALLVGEERAVGGSQVARTALGPEGCGRGGGAGGPRLGGSAPPTPPSWAVWEAGGHHGRQWGPALMAVRWASPMWGRVGTWGVWGVTFHPRQVEEEPDVHGQGLEGFVEFLHDLVVDLQGPGCGGRRVSPGL